MSRFGSGAVGRFVVLWALGGAACGGSGGAGAGETDVLPVADGAEPQAGDAGPPDATPAPPRPTTNPAPVAEDCSVVTDLCLLPWPNSAFEQVEPGTPTGLRVALPARVGMPTVWSRLSAEPSDGFSPVGTLATWLPRGVDLGMLPVSPEATTAPDSPILLLDADATAETWGQALPWRAGASIANPDGGQVLFLSPLSALRPGGRYAVLIDRSLLGTDGSPLAPTAAMSARIDGAVGTPAGAYFQDLLALADHVGRGRGEIAQLWDFHIRSAAGIRGLLETLAEETRAYAATRPPTLAENPRAGPHGSLI